MAAKHPIIITECPKCGAMQAARSKYLEPREPEVRDGKIFEVATMLKIECMPCAMRIEPPDLKPINYPDPAPNSWQMPKFRFAC